MTTQTETREKMTAEEAVSFDHYSEANAEIISRATYGRGCDCRPYEDVFTFNRWIAQGLGVKRGEHAICRVPLYKAITKKDAETGEEKTALIPCGTACMFCRCQVEERAEKKPYEKKAWTKKPAQPSYKKPEVKPESPKFSGVKQEAASIINSLLGGN